MVHIRIQLLPPRLVQSSPPPHAIPASKPSRAAMAILGSLLGVSEALPFWDQAPNGLLHALLPLHPPQPKKEQ
jgi:hypothetical protein